MYDGLIDQRLANQCLLAAGHRTPADVVAWFGAVQAQEYLPAKWGLALRLPDGMTDARIERALTGGRMLRTHVLRPTWHFVAAADIRWMLELTAPRIHRAMASYRRNAGLDAAQLKRAATVFERALEGRSLTRHELREVLAQKRFTATALQMAHLSVYAELEAIMCSGPSRDGRPTYALMSERVARARRLSRDEAIGELTKRYFRSHGPATIADFVWWSGLTVADTRRGLEINRARRETIDGRDYWTLGPKRRPPSARGTGHLLPIYDEYLVAYRDRAAVPHGPSKMDSAEAPVTFQHAIVIEGHVAGTWRTAARPSAKVELFPTRSLTARERNALAQQLERYERFRNGR